METSFFLLDAIALAILIFQGMRDERDPSSTGMTGLFRYKFDKSDADIARDKADRQKAKRNA